MASTIVVGTNSWVTLAEANTYFGDRPMSSEYWVSGNDKNAAILYAYKLLTRSNRYELPTTATQSMKDAQCELAYYLLQQLNDIDIRMGLQAQGVVQAGMLKEAYRGDLVGGGAFPFPATVVDLLSGYDTVRGMFVFDVERDEEEYTNYDAPTNLERE